MPDRRVLVLGSKGQLGRALLGCVPRGFEAFGGDLPEADITSPGIANVLGDVRPDAVINCAAWTNVDKAESAEDACFAVNAEGPGILAEACRDAGAFLVHISTDFVFGQHDEKPRHESEPPEPQGVYARSKAEGESRVLNALGASAAVVRTSWLFGEDGPNFILTILRLARERDDIAVVNDQYGSPTWTGHLAPALYQLLDAGGTGIFHIANREKTTWFDVARETVRQAGLSCAVRPTTTEAYGAPAPRPTFSYLEDERWRALGFASLPPWPEALHAYLAEKGVVRAQKDG